VRAGESRDRDRDGPARVNNNIVKVYRDIRIHFKAARGRDKFICLRLLRMNIYGIDLMPPRLPKTPRIWQNGAAGGTRARTPGKFLICNKLRNCAAPGKMAAPLCPYNEFSLVEERKHFNLMQQVHYRRGGNSIL
jgi:hypothetical protein